MYLQAQTEAGFNQPGPDPGVSTVSRTEEEMLKEAYRFINVRGGGLKQMSQNSHYNPQLLQFSLKNAFAG